MTNDDAKNPVHGMLAKIAGECFPVEVLQSGAGYCLGTRDGDGLPFTRESQEYWESAEQAEKAMTQRAWTQKPSL